MEKLFDFFFQEGNLLTKCIKLPSLTIYGMKGLFSRLNLELRDNEGRVPLWLALSCDTRVDPMDEDSLAAKLVKHGASPDAINNVTGQWSSESWGTFLKSLGNLP